MEATFPFINKADDDDSPFVYVFGPALVPEEVDSEGDIVSADVIREAAHDFIEHSQSLGLEHGILLKDTEAVIVESCIAPCDMVIDGHKIKAGTWLVGTRFYDAEIKKQIRAGKITGYSIGGVGAGFEEA